MTTTTTTTIEATATATEIDLTAAYETKPCTRCGGSGHYSYCSMYGTTCFGCAGKGHVYTKRAQAAIAYGKALRTVKASAVQVGWLFYVSPGPFNKGGWFTVLSVGFNGGTCTTDGVTTPYYTIETKNMSTGTFYDADVQAVPSKEFIADSKVKSLAYQATLTKTGTIRKAAVK